MNKSQLLVLIGQRGVSPAVAKAFKKVDRRNFVPEALKPMAFEDHPIPLPEGQTTSQPSLLAFILDRLSLKKGARVLEVGTGFGFQTALLSELVGRKGSVVSIEFFESLFKEAGRRLAGRKNVLLIHGDGKKGYAAKAPFDAIVVSAACSSLPKTLFEQLKAGGKMVYPQNSGLFGQDLLLVLKAKGGTPLMQNLLPVAFVPLR
ncbi:MAG: protein-L-isoaspartate O-methyltransferase [Candidatus Micrarchaeota archaeon]